MSSIAPSTQPKPRVVIPPWLTGPWGIVGLIAILYTLADLAWTYFHWGGSNHVSLINDLLAFPSSLFVIMIAWRVATLRTLDTQLRRAWFLLGSGFLMFFIGNVIWAYLQDILHIEPFPSIADVFYLGLYPFILWGVLTLSGIPRTWRERSTFLLDLLILFVAASLFVAYYVIVPTAAANNGNLLTQTTAVAYPIGSLILIGAMIALLYRKPRAATQSVFIFFLVGMGFYIISDFAFGYTNLAGTYVIGGWVDAGWNVAQLFFALAALRQIRAASAPEIKPGLIRLLDILAKTLPTLAVLLSYGLVFYVIAVNYSSAAEWLMAGALFLILLVISRQIVSPAFTDLPIRIKLILTLLMVSVLSVCLVAATSYFSIYSQLQSLAGDSLKAEVEIRAQTLGSEFSKQLDLIEGFVLGETIEYGIAGANSRYTTDQAGIDSQLQQEERVWQAALDTDPFVQNVLNNSMAQELFDFCKNFPHHSHILLTDQYGATVAATDRPDRYSQSSEDWWQAAYAQGRGAVYVSQPTFNPATQDFQVTMAVPVRADHRQDVIGVLRTSVDIQTILEVLVPSHLESQAGFSLLLPDGRMLNAQGDAQSLDPDTIARLQTSQNAGYVEVNFEGTLQMLSQARLVSSHIEDAEVLQNLNWTLLAYERPATIFAPLHTAWRAALSAMLFVLLLTSGIAVILAQILIAPISRLTGVAAQIAAGDFTTQAQVESNDEIGTLARTFNKMLSVLSLVQQELRESEALYRSLVDDSPDTIVVHSQGRVQFINPAGAKLLGANRTDELIGQPILNIMPSENCESAQKEMERTEAAREPIPLLQQTMHRLDGTSFEAEFRIIPISYAGQPATQFVMRDITERKNAQEKIHQLLSQVSHQRGELEIRVEQRTAELNTLNQRLQNELAERYKLVQSLQESEQRFHLVFETSPDAIVLIDPHDPDGIWKIVDCNPTACKMNGYPREELIGQSIDIFNLIRSTADEFAASLQRLRHEGVLYGIEATHRHKDGHFFPIEYSTSLITIGDRELLLSIDRDITERKQAEEDLKHAKEAAEESQRVAEAASGAKSEFLSRMSHELRTPMNAILGFAQLLEMSHKELLSATQKERVKQIVKGGQHLLDLINEILDISRIEANRLHISPEPVSVGESIQEALDLTVPLAVKRHIQIVTKSGRLEDKPFVMADRQRFKQVLLNLLGNAVKYNYDGGSVIISCKQTPSNRWHISITDTGPGISKENLSRLFVPFERLAADQPNVEGTGLGLVLAKRLIELMEGQIGVESAPGRGSTFWIELPSAESPVDRLRRVGGTGELPTLSAAARTILYVEDNVANFELIKQVLADYSQIELLWSADIKSGVELAHARRPNLILLDLHLGGMDGAEILRQLKQDNETAEIPVVVVSADATPGQIKRLMSWGAHAYLTKPLDVRQFVRLIEELLAEKVG